MITGQDIDRCILDNFDGDDFNDMTLDEAKEYLRQAERDLEEIEPWIEALNAFIRTEEVRLGNKSVS